MKKTFVDPEAGWTVTQEPTESQTGAEVTQETITDPQTGKTYWRIRPVSGSQSITEWVLRLRQLGLDGAEDEGSVTDLEQERKQRLHQLYPELAVGAEVPAGLLGKIKLIFAQWYAFWDVCLPEEDVVRRRRGKIVKRGWAIWYLFGSDEKGEYLDCYASHRMTEDSHDRIYADGHCETLPAIGPCVLTSKDPQEMARQVSEYFEKNRQIAAMLEAKGFELKGDEPGSVQLNRYHKLRNPIE